MLFVDAIEESKEGKEEMKSYLLLNVYSLNPEIYGYKTTSQLMDKAWIEYSDNEKLFDDLWAKAKPYPLEQLKSELVDDPLPHKSDYLNARAISLHRKGQLKEASSRYKEILKRRKPREPIQREIRLVKKFLPRVFVTEDEEFKLKDLVVVIHPQKPVIGYHLVWEDDIDFLCDNLPGDDEVVWVRYGRKEERVERVWSAWYQTFLSTKDAVQDTNGKCQPKGRNRECGRVKVFVQWGKHGSLLKGWREWIGIDERLPGRNEYEPLQFSRLKHEGRRRIRECSYGDQFSQRFPGDIESFAKFERELNVEEILNKRKGNDGKYRNIVVSEYPNAVIAQWVLPYNVSPQTEWPPDMDQ
jgi:hypothetical protein